MQAWTKICRQPAQNLKKMQDQLLSNLINSHIAPRHPFYRNMFKEKGIDPERIKGVADLQRLPFTVKEDIMPRPEDRFRPKTFELEQPPPGQKEPTGGGLFGLLKKKEKTSEPGEYKMVQLYYTSGRTAKMLPLVFTGYDIDNLHEAGARWFDILGLGRDHTLVNALSFVPGISYWQMYYSTVDLGATSLQTGGGRVLGMEKILRGVQNMEAPVLAASPGYALLALQVINLFNLKMPFLERIVTGTDYIPMVLVEKIRRAMSAIGAAGDRVQRIYCISEAKAGWAECAPGYGYHTYPDHVFLEVVDPETGEVKSEGEPGELVITNLDARGTVFIRLRSGDITTGGITWEPCPGCGRTVPRILGDVKRKDGIYRLQGEQGERLLDSYDLFDYMTGQDEVLQWYVEIVRPGAGDQLNVVIRTEESADRESLITSLGNRLKERYGVPVSISDATLEAIAGVTGMEKRVTEQRVFDKRKD